MLYNIFFFLKMCTLLLLVQQLRLSVPSRYEYIPAPSLTWSAAQHACQEKGMQLVSIESEAEQDRIRKMISKARSGETDIYTWTGCHKDATGVFRWIATGQLCGRKGSTYHNWHQGEPNNSDGNGKACVEMRSHVDNYQVREDTLA